MVFFNLTVESLKRKKKKKEKSYNLNYSSIHLLTFCKELFNFNYSSIHLLTFCKDPLNPGNLPWKVLLLFDIIIDAPSGYMYLVKQSTYNV